MQSISQLRRPALLLVQQLSQQQQQQLYARALATGPSVLHDQHGVAAGATAAVLSLGLGVAVAGSASADAPAPAPAQQVPADPYAVPAGRPLPSHVTVYQYEVCPYCCKVKAALDYYKLPYTVVEVNPLTKAELKWSTYRKVPVVKLDEEVVVDSSAIMSRLAADMASTSSSKKGGPLGGARSKAPVGGSGSAEEERQWRKWVDDRLVKVLTANIYRNWDESVASFKYITDQTEWGWGTREVARWVGAVLMWRIGSAMPKKYNIEGDLRSALYDCCNEFVDALGTRQFMGGAQPNLADLAVFGVLRAVRKTGTFDDVMAHSRIAPWFRAMEAAVGPSQRLPA